MKETNSAAKGMFVLSIAGILVKVLSVFYTPALKSILGDKGYGMYSQTTQVFVFVYAIACMGAQPAIAKVVAELSATGSEKGALRALKISRKLYGSVAFILALLMVALAPIVAQKTNSPDIAYGIMALAPCVVITSILSTYRGFMQGKNNMTSIAVSQIIEQAVNIVLSLACAYILVKATLAFGNAGAQVGTSVGALFACFYLVYCYFKNKYKHKAIEYDNGKRISDKRILHKLIAYSIPIILSAGLQNLGGLIDLFNVKARLLVAGFSPTDADILYGHLGFYQTLYGVPLVIITAIGTTVLPALSKSVVLKDHKEARRKIRQGFKLIYIIAIPAAIALSVACDDVYRALTGNTNGASLMFYGSFVIVLMATTQLQSIVLQGINKFYYMLSTFVIGIIFKITLNYIFVGITDINIYGVLIGNCFWHLVPALLNHKKIKKTMKMKLPMMKIILKPLFASALMAGTIILIKYPFSIVYRFLSPSRYLSIIFLILSLIFGGFIYCYSMILIKGIRKQDIESISPKIIKFLPRFIRVKLK